MKTNTIKRTLAQVCLIFLLAAMLPGCGFSPSDVKIAEDKCNQNGGFTFARRATLGTELVIVCEDGARFEIKKNTKEN